MRIMNTRAKGIVAIAAAVASLVPLATPAEGSNLVAQNNLTYWFHPADAACPAYYYNPNDSGSEQQAQTACEASGQSCVSDSGTAGPGC
jgi:hypothetical protein